MHKELGHRREMKVDHIVEVRHVDASRSNVRDYEVADFGVAEHPVNNAV